MLAAPEPENNPSAAPPAAAPVSLMVPQGWGLAIASVAIGSLTIFAIFWPTVLEAVTLWYERASYNYAFLVIPISLYLVYERRHGLAALRPSPVWWGLAGMAVMSAAWLVADAIDVSVGRDIAVVGMVQALLLTVLGWRVYWFLLFPFLFLWLLVPTGDFLLPVLQRIAMKLSTFGMQFTGITVFTEGFTVETPTGLYTVAPGCAGLNFLLAGFAFSLLYANLQYQSWRKRIACVVVMLGVAIVSNGVRIVAIITVAHYTNRQMNIVDDHLLYGWGFFAVILLVLTWFGMRFQDPAPVYGGRGSPVASNAGVLSDARPGLNFRVVAAAVVAVALAAAAPGVTAWRNSSAAAESGVEARIEMAAPPSIGTWRRADHDGAWLPATPSAHQLTAWTYRRDGRTVDLAIGYFWRQTKTRDLVSTGNAVFDGQRWRFVGSRPVNAMLGDAPLPVVETRIRSRAEGERLAWRAYWVDGRFTTNRIVAKLLQAKAMFIGGEARSAFVSASTPLDSASLNDGAAAALADFFAAASELPAILSNAKKSRQ